MAKTIKCNQCGAADLIKIEENEYTCKYCHSRIVVDKPKFDLGNFAKTFKAENLYSASQTTITPSGQVIKKASFAGCLFFIIIFLAILSGIIVPIILSNSGTVELTKSVITSDGWQLSYTQQVHYTNGSKGAAIWQFTEENYNWKKNRSVLTIIDPVTKKELKREIVIAEHESSGNISLWDLFNGGKIIGDTIFFTPKDGGLIGRNIYTGKIAVDNEYFEKLIGNPVAEARAYSNNRDNYLEIKDAEGVEFYYFPQQKKVVKKEEFRNRKNAKLSLKYFYVLAGSNDKKHIQRIQQEMTDFESPSYFNSLTIREFKRDKNYYKKYRQLFNIDSIPLSHGFFKADIVSWDDTTVVVKYKKNILENSPFLISKFSLSGKKLWSVNCSEIKEFKEDKKSSIKSDLSFDFFVRNNLLILSINSPQKAACAINLINGKTEWTYKCIK